MLKKTIKYVDYNGEERTEDFYFNLTKAELVDMEFSTNGGLKNMLIKISQEKDTVKIAEFFKQIILKAYGEKSADGKRFMKKDANGQPLSDAFAETEAYSELYMELASDDKAASAFVIGIIPSDLAKEVEKNPTLAIEQPTV